MGILNQIWWLLGVLMAAPLLIAGSENVFAGNYPIGILFLSLGVVILFLPEYLKWRLIGGSSPFDRVPLFRKRGDQRRE